MTLNVRLEEVPDAILEAVMARILRNRQKLQDNQQQIQRPLLQPKPQVRNQGADNRTWKKPEPAATPRQTPDGAWLLIPSDAEFNAKVRGIPPFNLVNSFPGGEQIINAEFLPTSGPNESGALFGGEAVDDPEFTFGARSQVTQDILPIPKEPASKSFTVEALIKAYVPPLDASARYMNAFIDLGIARLYFSRDWYTKQREEEVLPGEPTSEAMPDQPLARVELYCLNSLISEAYSRVRPPGALTPEEGGIFISDEALLMPSLEDNIYHHLAVVQMPGNTQSTRNASLYLNGIRLATRTGLYPFWASYIRIAFEFGQRLGDPVLCSAPLVHGVRYTPRALYTGDTYTPPTSITSLA
jgi:hypothetical protein